jgi:hypothetical protein
MRKLLMLVVCALVALLFATCDKVEGPFYIIPENEDVTVVFPDLDPSSVYRKVLFEEFTGHRCTNCPDGHLKLEELQERYGDTLVAVGIHFGSLAKPVGETFSYDFRTEAGNRIGEAYAIDAIPAAIINRNHKEGGWPRNQWLSVMPTIDRTKVPAAIQIINEYDENNKTVKSNVKVTLLQNYNNELHLVLLLLEDGIVKPQKDGSQDILDYVHNHVLRASLTDPFGYVLRNGTVSWSAGDTEMFASTIDFSETDWVPENCCVVAFLLDPVNEEVLQVEKLDVISR